MSEQERYRVVNGQVFDQSKDWFAIPAEVASALNQNAALVAALELVRWNVSGPLDDERHTCRGCGHEEGEGCGDFCPVDNALAAVRQASGQEVRGDE